MYLIGIDPTKTWASGNTPGVFGMGQVGFNVGKTGSEGYVFVKAPAAAMVVGLTYVFDPATGVAAAVTTTNTAPGTGGGKPVGVAKAAIPANGYGWLQVYGNGQVQVLASAAAFTRLNSTATAGSLDDDATIASRVIDGIALTASRPASAGLAAGFLNWPRVGITL